MKFTLFIAALFATSAIAAPCGKKHVDKDEITTIPNEMKYPVSNDNTQTQTQTGSISSGNGPVGSSTSGGLLNVPVTLPINVDGKQLINVLGKNNNQETVENSIEQKQKAH